MINRFKEIFCLETERLILILWQCPVLTKKSSQLVVSLDEFSLLPESLAGKGGGGKHIKVSPNIWEKKTPRRPFVSKDISCCQRNISYSIRCHFKFYVQIKLILNVWT